MTASPGKGQQISRKVRRAMASWTREASSGVLIQWTGADGCRRKLRIGEVDTDRDAETMTGHVEAIAQAQAQGRGLPSATAAWLASVGDTLYARMAAPAVGLVKPRCGAKLGEWLDRFIDEKKREVKPSSLAKLGQTKAKMVEHLKAGRDLRDLSTDDAARWRSWLADSGLSLATVKTHSGNAKVMMGEAVRRGIIDRNPFAGLASGSTRRTDAAYVTPEDAATVIEACPTLALKLLVGLARYAGLRCPSESHLLTWGDVDWDRSRLRVRSPKTEGHAGKGERMVPIEPRLYSLLTLAHIEAPAGDGPILTLKMHGGLRRKVEAVIAKAKVAQWPDLWQTLRASCETEWAGRYPQHAVSYWIGHSLTVSGRHYLMVPDGLYALAAKGGKDADQNPGLNPGQLPAVTGLDQPRTEVAPEAPTPENPGKQGHSRLVAAGHGVSERVSEGIRTPTL
jgi:integrase